MYENTMLTSLINSAPMTVIATTLECGTGPPSCYASYRQHLCKCASMCMVGEEGVRAHERELYFVGQREYICYTSAMCPRKHVTRTTDMMFQKSQCSFFEDPLYNLEVKSTVYCVHAKSYRPQFLRKQ